MNTFGKYYGLSVLWTFLTVGACFIFGGFEAAFLCALLGVMEVSLSLDNAVVNAKVLQPMDATWRHRFLTWGMLVSVLGVRLLFPILIVWSTSSLDLIQSAYLPFHDPALYASTVSAAHVKIAGFGGSFLLMVFAAFMMDEEKETNWIPGLERALKWLGGNTIWGPIAFNALVTAAVQYLVVDGPHQEQFMISSSLGAAAWLAIHYLGEYLGDKGTAAKIGMGAFIYLNVLDASFSFDGVVGAFALSNNILLIAAGLGIGSLFVRSMTIHMVEAGTLGELKYLEHGAFWSIGVLTALMFASTIMDVPEVVSGLSAAFIIGAAALHSIIVNKKEAKEATA